MQSFASIVLLSVVLIIVSFLALYLMLKFWQRDQDAGRRLRTAVYAVLPITVICGVVFAFPSRVSIQAFLMIPMAGVAAAYFVLLWRKIPAQRATAYTAGMVAVAVLTSYVVKSLFAGGSPPSPRSSGESSPSIGIFLAVVGFPALVWYLSSRTENDRHRMWVRCIGAAVIIAPVPMVGHGVPIVLPAAFIWAMVSMGEAGPLLVFGTLLSVAITSAVLVPFYKRWQSKRAPRETKE